MDVSYMLRYMRKYRVAVWKFRSVYLLLSYLTLRDSLVHLEVYLGEEHASLK